MRMQQRWPFPFAMISFCLLACHHPTLAQDAANPRVTRTVEIIREIEEGLHPLRIDYFEATGDSVLELFLEDAAGKRRKLGEEAFFHASTQ